VHTKRLRRDPSKGESIVRRQACPRSIPSADLLLFSSEHGRRTFLRWRAMRGAGRCSTGCATTRAIVPMRSSASEPRPRPAPGRALLGRFAARLTYSRISGSPDVALTKEIRRKLLDARLPHASGHGVGPSRSTRPPYLAPWPTIRPAPPLLPGRRESQLRSRCLNRPGFLGVCRLEDIALITEGRLCEGG